MRPHQLAELLGATALMLSLAACGGGAHPPAEDPPTAATATPDDFKPVLELEDETVKSEDGQAPVSVDVQVPMVSGVEQEHADAFTNGFKYGLTERLGDLSKQSTEEQGTCTGDGDQCEPYAAFELTQAQIYGDYATISYELTVAPNRSTARASVFAESLTMNMRTGEIAEPSEFIALDAPDLPDAITESGECTQDYSASADDSNRVDAFSPTDDGMYLSWDKGTFSDTACGVGKVTLPWDEFGIDQQPKDGDDDQQPKDDGNDEPATEGAGSACAGSPELPEGVDERVCEEGGKGAKELTAVSGDRAEIATPSENIMCEIGRGSVECLMVEPETRVELPSEGKARMTQGSRPITTWDRETLDYGEVGSFTAITCISQEVGLSCWNIETKHGLFLSREEVVLW